jgi:hypothetical protein
LLFECGDGTTLLIYFRPGDNNADHTQIRFWTEDIEADVVELEGRGVVFEEYDTEYIKTVDHIATSAGIGRSAWFKDPAGNTIALLRRTYASIRAAAGDDPAYIAEQGGWEDPSFVLRVYAKAIKRRAKLPDGYREPYDRALEWAEIGRIQEPDRIMPRFTDNGPGQESPSLSQKETPRPRSSAG